MTDQLKDAGESHKLRFEAGMLEFVKMQQRIEEQQALIEKQTREIHLLTLERDKLTFDMKDLRETMRAAQDERSTAVSHRVAYETLAEMLRKLLNEFVPPVTTAKTPLQALAPPNVGNIGATAVGHALNAPRLGGDALANSAVG